ncbi:MAG: hypothetical protein KF712_18140 [Akkermansiaceae bacterium]|nr:hypothetical protein [Akkermansiaceae bacterium]
MKHMIKCCGLAFIALAFASPLHAEDKKKGPDTEEADVIDTGTYKGKVHKVVPAETEIYVKADDGKLIELYLKPETSLTKGDKKVGFDALKEGQSVEVKVENTGGKLKPIAVKILD